MYIDEFAYISKKQTIYLLFLLKLVNQSLLMPRKTAP